jgi:hypothetical protein
MSEPIIDVNKIYSVVELLRKRARYYRQIFLTRSADEHDKIADDLESAIVWPRTTEIAHPDETLSTGADAGHDPDVHRTTV